LFKNVEWDHNFSLLDQSTLISDQLFSLRLVWWSSFGNIALWTWSVSVVWRFQFA